MRVYFKMGTVKYMYRCNRLQYLITKYIVGFPVHEMPKQENKRT